MKYRLKRDLPWAKAGTDIHTLAKAEWVSDDGENMYSLYLTPNSPNWSDWVEEVGERWKPERFDTYWRMRNDGRVSCHLWNDDAFDNRTYDFGNYFETEAQAREASRRIKQVLRDFHEELAKGEDDRQCPSR